VSGLLYMPVDHQAVYDAMLQWSPPKGSPAYVYQAELAALVYTGKTGDWTSRKLAKRWGMGWDRARKLIRAWFDWHRETCKGLKKGAELLAEAEANLLAKRGPKPKRAPAPPAEEPQDGIRTESGLAQDGPSEEEQALRGEVRTGTGREQDGSHAGDPYGGGEVPEEPSPQPPPPKGGGAPLSVLGLRPRQHRPLADYGCETLDDVAQLRAQVLAGTAQADLLTEKAWSWVELALRGQGVPIPSNVVQLPSARDWMAEAEAAIQAEPWGAQALHDARGYLPEAQRWVLDGCHLDQADASGSVRLVVPSDYHLEAADGELEQRLLSLLARFGVRELRYASLTALAAKLEEQASAPAYTPTTKAGRAEA